jgi:hypothetical protein
MENIRKKIARRVFDAALQSDLRGLLRAIHDIHGGGPPQVKPLCPGVTSHLLSSLVTTTMIIEERIAVSAKPEVIFSIYADVERWNTWDPDTKSSSLNGPFAVGSKGRLCPTKGKAVPMEIVSLVAGRSFTAQSKIPLFQMAFDHELTPTESGTEVLHRVTFSGPLSFLLGRIVGAQVREGLPKTLLSLKKLAESRE